LNSTTIAPLDQSQTEEVSSRPGAWQRFVRNPRSITGAVVLLVLVLSAVLAPYIVKPFGVDPITVNLRSILEGPSQEHILGTDRSGRDVFARLLYGARVSLTIGISSALLAVTLGTAIGLAAGYFGRWTDHLLMRAVDVGLSIPPFLLLLVIVSLFEVDVVGLAVIIGLTSWMDTARLVRSKVLALKEIAFIEAAVASGLGSLRIIMRHLLPNVMQVTLVAATLRVGYAIYVEASLSFIGLGIQEPLASWGNMLTNAYENVWFAPLLTVYPGLLIFTTVMAVNFLGDGLRDAFDPKTQQ